MDDDLCFVGQILDNVHGFISYTKAEKQIMDTQLFKRLQSIKQLSIVNQVFPGSEHTRYIHSLGVMYIADKMAISLGLTIPERKILRLAGLLHDIGHYPLSHVGETPYRKPLTLEELPDTELCKSINTNVKNQIESFSISIKTTLMAKREKLHHEAIGALIVKNCKEIRDIIIAECDDAHAPDIIADIITGNVERAATDPLLVQIIHSELDADGIDYLMRDATFSGTSFGSFEMNQLIRCLDIGYSEDKRILCIKPKGIAAADQYLINKFFSRSQVVFNRHIVISEWMAECVIDWMQKHHAVFPSGKELELWVKESRSEYLNFTDNMFWSALDQILTDKLSDLVPHYIKVFCECLMHHDEPKCIKESEIKFITNSVDDAKSLLTKADIVTDNSFLDCRITILSEHCMSSQTPIEEFRKEVARKEKTEAEDVKVADESIPSPELSRLMECISVKSPNGEIHLLCDDPRSLMRTMYNQTLVILRSYEFPQHMPIPES